MSYTFNPHRHVKIWLSKNPDIFLNQENQLRLVKMRNKNSDDEIHLLYAKELLSSEAVEQLESFCKKHTIKPVCIEDDIFPHCSASESEQNLIRLYQAEVDALGAGGNLAAASDILRWMRPVYQLGIYADFDVSIGTRKLPKSITVEAPILLNIGPLIYVNGGQFSTKNLESIALNNDMIAVVGDDSITHEKIEKIQQAIGKAYQSNLVYREWIEKLTGDVLAYHLQMNASPVNAMPVIQELIRRQEQKTTALLDLSVGLGLNAPNPIALRKAISEKKIQSTVNFKQSLFELRLLYQAQISAPDINPEDKQRLRGYLAMQNEELIDTLESDYRDRLFLETVVETTGPGRVLLGLFDRVAIDSESFKKEVSPYSFEHYNLSQNFYSKNSYDLQSVVQKKNLKVGDLCDASWSEQGALAVAEREEKVVDAARKVQRTWKAKHESDRKNDSEQDELDAESQTKPSKP